MLGLIILLAIAYACARGIENGMADVSKDHKKRIAKSAKKNGRRTGAKLAAWTATGATATGTFWRGFMRGWKREWPKAKKRAATKFGRYEPEPELAIGEDIGPDGAPVAKTDPAKTETPITTIPKPAEAPTATKPAADPKPTGPESRAFVLIKNDDPEIDPTTASTTGGTMAIAQLQEITGVDTLKAFVARYASEKNVSAEEVSSLAQRTVDELAAIEAAIEQATALEFGDDGGSLDELSALRDLAIAAQAAALAYQKAALDAAALAAQSSKNIHDRHSNIQEAVAAQGGRMASKQAYTADA
ncbi:hypothetical protein [Streptomyces sp. NRRL B-24720]|uniref:hypothetical protein n=1 Tax=Streptomyces sp. NRRL B-24720 TaxID=1476876 RepID=UPI0004C9A4F6|nr:hypothetical protein [Streptomyces sp. NRRL B-24720]